MAGVSLRGTVEKREKESVYLKLDIDGADGKALHPYPWIPPTGNVMYCMPQEGTEAYLYFPEAEEESAYAVSEIHNSRCPVFADAQRRELVTEHGKKLRLHADMLGFAGGKEETVQECRMREDGIHFGAGRGKLQVTGREQILFHAPEISLDAVQKIGQYKMESMAKEKAGMLYPRGGGNPATGGDGYGVGELQNEYNALSSQGILAGTEYEYYKPFDDAPEYEEYKEVPTWLKVVAGVAVAAVVGLAVGALVVATGGLAAAALGVTAVQLEMTAGVLTAGAGIVAVAATAASDKKNGTESSLGDYIRNAFSASARVGASCIAITLGMYGAEVMTLTVSGGMGLIPVGGTVVTLSQLAGAFQLVAGIVTSQNLLFQIEEVLMFCTSGKEMGAPTGNGMHDSVRELTEMASTQFAFYGLMNPYTYQRPKITLLPNETGLTVPGGTGVAVVPNGTAPALKQPYLPGQYTEYPAAVQGWAQQALPGGGSGIESGKDSVDDIVKGVENGDILLSNNIQKGNYGEMNMDVYFKSQGYERISLDRVTDLNAPTHQGIDGVYYNLDGHPPYIIGEAKYGSSRLAILADGTPQMSDKWIIDRLENAVGEGVANDIKMEMILNPDNVGSILVHVSSNGEIDITKLIDGIKQENEK